MGDGDAAAGRAAGLHGLKSLAARDTAADFIDDRTQGRTHGDFDQAGVIDLSAQGEYLRTVGFLGSDGGKPVAAF